MIGSLVQTPAFFWCITTRFIFNLQLNEEERVLFEQFLLPMEYLKMTEERSGKKERRQAERTRKKLESTLKERMDPYLKKIAWSSCNEARGNVLSFFRDPALVWRGIIVPLSLKHHASRHLSAGKLSSRVVLHNYFSKRKDGTTAAERFFHQKPKDIFCRLLERVSWPVRPRSKKCKIEVKTCCTTCTLTPFEVSCLTKL